MTEEQQAIIAQALWAAHEVWILPVSDRRNWDEMSALDKEQWFKSAEIVGPGLVRILQREAYEDAARQFDEMVPECILSPRSVAATIRSRLQETQ